VLGEWRHVWLLMQSLPLKNIALLLSLEPVHIKVHPIAYPPHWRSIAHTPSSEKTIGREIKKRRLSLHLLQSDVAKKLGIHVVSISNWERGVSQPSRPMRRKIRVFLDSAPQRAPKVGRKRRTALPFRNPLQVTRPDAPVPGRLFYVPCIWACPESVEGVCEQIQGRGSDW
jgi:transcriptional regulator with XRE-family HTH domain